MATPVPGQSVDLGVYDRFHAACSGCAAEDPESSYQPGKAVAQNNGLVSTKYGYCSVQKPVFFGSLTLQEVYE